LFFFFFFHCQFLLSVQGLSPFLRRQKGRSRRFLRGHFPSRYFSQSLNDFLGRVPCLRSRFGNIPFHSEALLLPCGFDLLSFGSIGDMSLQEIDLEDVLSPYAVERPLAVIGFSRKQFLRPVSFLFPALLFLCPSIPLLPNAPPFF